MSFTKALFPIGKVVITPGASDALREAGRTAEEFLLRHVCGDWGDLDTDDRLANDWAILQEDRILSSYAIAIDVTVWVLTESDRSVTTLLLPSDY